MLRGASNTIWPKRGPPPPLVHRHILGTSPSRLILQCSIISAYYGHVDGYRGVKGMKHAHVHKLNSLQISYEFDDDEIEEYRVFRNDYNDGNGISDQHEYRYPGLYGWRMNLVTSARLSADRIMIFVAIYGRISVRLIECKDGLLSFQRAFILPQPSCSRPPPTEGREDEIEDEPQLINAIKVFYLSNNEPILVSADTFGQTSVWRCEVLSSNTLQPWRTFRVPQSAWSMAFDPRTNLLYIGCNEHVIYSFSLSNQHEEASVDGANSSVVNPDFISRLAHHEHNIPGLATDDLGRLASVSIDGTAAICDIEHSKTQKIPLNAWVWAVVFVRLFEMEKCSDYDNLVQEYRRCQRTAFSQEGSRPPQSSERLLEETEQPPVAVHVAHLVRSSRRLDDSDDYEAIQWTLDTGNAQRDLGLEGEEASDESIEASAERANNDFDRSHGHSNMSESCGGSSRNQSSSSSTTFRREEIESDTGYLTRTRVMEGCNESSNVDTKQSPQSHPDDDGGFDGHDRDLWVSDHEEESLEGLSDLSRMIIDLDEIADNDSIDDYYDDMEAGWAEWLPGRSGFRFSSSDDHFGDEDDVEETEEEEQEQEQEQEQEDTRDFDDELDEYSQDDLYFEIRDRGERPIKEDIFIFTTIDRIYLISSRTGAILDDFNIKDLFPKVPHYLYPQNRLCMSTWIPQLSLLVLGNQCGYVAIIHLLLDVHNRPIYRGIIVPPESFAPLAGFAPYCPGDPNNAQSIWYLLIVFLDGRSLTLTINRLISNPLDFSNLLP